MTKRANKLDAFAADLDAWLPSVAEGGEGLTYAQAAERLLARGVKTSTGKPVAASQLCEWWMRRVEARLDADLLGRIATGARLASQLDKEFQRSAAPEAELLVKLMRSLVLSLSVKGQADGKHLEMADRFLGKVIDWEKLQRKDRELGFDQRRLELLERKAKQAEETDEVITDAELTPEERAQKIREIYGRA